MIAGTVAKIESPILCKVHHKKIYTSVNLSALNEVFASLKSASILGANSSKIDADRFSYWAEEPIEIFEFWAGQKDPFVKLHKILNKYKLEKDSRLKTQDPKLKTHNSKLITQLPKGMFTGGWIGYFSYELGRYIERLPETTIDDLEMPLIRLCFYDSFIAYDHIEGIFWIIALQLPGDIEEPKEKLEYLEKLLSDAQKIRINQPAPVVLETIDFSQIQCNMSKEYYLQTLDKIKNYIYNGDVYQVNFSQRFECDYNGRAIDLFHWQNYYNPSPYSAYLDGGSFHIVSASPEMFITIADDFITTKPIKGTRPRINRINKKDSRPKTQDQSHLNPDLIEDYCISLESCVLCLESILINAKNFRELLCSEKEQAELNMIIDLERNDVAKICEPGTRKVIQSRTIESYPTVYHAVATVGGQLGNDVTFCDVLKAMFPGGSITGAPKIRSMEIIDEAEPTARGVYTGSIGFIGLDGSVCLNIAIRTIIIKDRKAYAQTGGGIVADSDPQAEWDETITKAKALIGGIRATQSHK